MGFFWSRLKESEKGFYELRFRSVGRAAGKSNTSPPLFTEKKEVNYQLGVRSVNGLRNPKSC